ncbi:protein MICRORCHIDIA 6-like isoform X2 [Macadamia integrifolia]|uniref:protein MICRORCHIDIA 6-like isoform X2 n=1 Tax=Macadamia integrifolia TaxID=60698 RepID=UPI001C4F0AF6|nr:protein MICRORCHIDIA 6-like isoform X2 [Macadamia integrifolia]
MRFTDFIDLSSDDEVGEMGTKAIKQEPDSGAKAIKQEQDSVQSTRQDSVENRSLSALNAGQYVENISSSVLNAGCILDRGGSPTDGSSLSSASPGCSVPLRRQFWKAGDYDIKQSSKTLFQSGKNHLRVHPKFLHSNATSHKWAFGAIAELLDNAIDEIQNGATFIIVDKISIPRDGSPALLIQDDGGGMDPDTMRRCMSFGFSEKKSKYAIGQYGNGFKTSTMRLGADVIVFSRHKNDSGKPGRIGYKCFTSSSSVFVLFQGYYKAPLLFHQIRILTQSIGLLSFTFLRQMGYDRIVVPMVDYEFNPSTETLEILPRYGGEHLTSNLSILLQWSPYTTEAELLSQFNGMGDHGTKVVIYNLWFNDDGDMELDFEADPEDILITGGQKKVRYRHSKIMNEQHIANRFHYSLRVYSSILYLRIPQSFRIILRGRVVVHHIIANDLKFPECIIYRPQIGGNIEPFWRVVHNSDSRGRGVVGILEANFIEPTHDKQDFEKTSLFQKLESRLKQMTNEYWAVNCGLIGYVQIRQSPVPVITRDSPQSGTHGLRTVGNCQISSRNGLPIKRKDHDHMVEHERIKSRARSGENVIDTSQNRLPQV